MLHIPALRSSAVAFGVVFLIYLLTSGPTFGFIDEGELAAVAATGGVAHPTGYPTFTILGGLVTLLPFRDISELLVLASLLTALGAGVSVLAFARLVRYVREGEEGVLVGVGETRRAKGKRGAKGKDAGKDRGKHKGKDAEETGDAIGSDEYGRGIAAWLRSPDAIALLGGLAVGLSGIWWRQGTGLEVYALHAFFLPLLLLFFLRWIEFEEERSGGNVGIGITKPGFIFSLILGLSFTNHMTTIFLAPPFLYFFFSRLGVGLPALRRLPGLVPGFIIGLLPYLWLPIRAASDPRFNWSNPESLWAIGRHLSGAQYGVWIFTNPNSFALQSGFIFPVIAQEFLWVGLLIAGIGIWRLFEWRAWTATAALALFAAAAVLLISYSGDSVSGVVIALLLIGIGIILLPILSRSGRDSRRGRAMAAGVMLLLLLLTNLLYAGGYDILDIESYYLAAILGIGGLITFGFEWLSKRLRSTVVVSAGGILLAAMLAVNWGRSDRSDLWLVEDAAHNMLESVPEDAVIISGMWDFWLSGSWYLQGVEGVRPDVAVIDHNLLKYSWYLDQLENEHPELMARVAPEVAAFREQGYLFERDLPYDAATIDRRYVEMIDAMIATSLDAGRPVLLTHDVNERGSVGYRYGAAWATPDRRVPYELGYLINPDGEYVPQEFPDWRFRKSSRGPDGYEAEIYRWYATAAASRAQYEALHGRDSLAREYLRYALSFDPEWEPPTGPLAQGMRERIGQMMAVFSELRIEN